MRPQREQKRHDDSSLLSAAVPAAAAAKGMLLFFCAGRCDVERSQERKKDTSQRVEKGGTRSGNPCSHPSFAEAQNRPRLFSPLLDVLLDNGWPPPRRPPPPPEILHPSPVPRTPLSPASISTLDPERTRKFFLCCCSRGRAFTQPRTESRTASHLTSKSKGSSNLRPSASCSLRSRELVVLARAILMHSDPVQIPVQIPPKGPWVSSSVCKIITTAGRLS